MSLALIRAQIKVILLTVSGITIVHDYHRWTNRPEQFLTLYKDTNDKINAWSFARRGSLEIRETTGPRYVKIYDIGFAGYYGLDDSARTGVTFQDLIELISEKFRINSTLNGTAQKHDLIQVELVAEMIFGEKLVHYAELGLAVYEEIN